MLVKTKLNSIKNLISQASRDLEISHETVVDEKEKYKRMKENIRMMKSRDKLGVNNKSNRENRGNA